MKEPEGITDYDECECGDYRHQHENGRGRCEMPDDLTHGFEECDQFRLYRSATQIPTLENDWRPR